MILAAKTKNIFRLGLRMLIRFIKYIRFIRSVLLAYGIYFCSRQSASPQVGLQAGGEYVVRG